MGYKKRNLIKNKGEARRLEIRAMEISDLHTSNSFDQGMTLTSVRLSAKCVRDSTLADVWDVFIYFSVG